MADYVIGDVHGCRQELLNLLNKINFSEHDTLYFVGDLVHVGPESLATLRLIYNLHLKNQAKIVLGNHELCLLYAYYFLATAKAPAPTMQLANQLHSIADGKAIIQWLQQAPLARYLDKYKTLIVHAGIHPNWSLDTTLKLATEANEALNHKDKFRDLLAKIFLPEPNYWSPNFTSSKRVLAICNYLTRVRFCDSNFNLDFTSKNMQPPNQDFKPWFELLENWQQRIIFGHWSALDGNTKDERFIAIDTGCVWGRNLTAYNLTNGAKTIVPSLQPKAHFNN